jgi:hypothetical protein
MRDDNSSKNKVSVSILAAILFIPHSDVSVLVPDLDLLVIKAVLVQDPC